MTTSAGCGVGRSLSMTERSHSQSCPACPGHDFATDKIQADRGRVTEKKEPDQGEHTCQGGASLPHSEARVRIREGAISRIEEEPRSSLCGFRTGQCVHAPQTVGPAGGVVCPEGTKIAPSG